MSADTGHAINWVATRKVDDEIEYLISNAPTWGADKRFAKVFDTKAEAEKAPRNFNCTGAHRMGDKWMPCKSHAAHEEKENNKSSNGHHHHH